MRLFPPEEAYKTEAAISTAFILRWSGVERFEYLHYVTLLQVSGEQGLYHKHLLPFTAIN